MYLYFQKLCICELHILCDLDILASMVTKDFRGRYPATLRGYRYGAVDVQINHKVRYSYSQNLKELVDIRLEQKELDLAV